MNLNGEKFTLMRNQTAGNKISSLYDTTNRGMSQPIVLAEGVETLGELEFIEYMKKKRKLMRLLQLLIQENQVGLRD